MSWSLRLVTPPSVEPLNADQAKQHCRVETTEDDDYFDGLVTAARSAVEEYLSRSLITQTWELGIPRFPFQDRILLPRGPVQSVTSVIYTDSGLSSHTMTANTDYLTDIYSELAEIVIPFGKVWPTAVLSTMRPVVIRFVAGYGSDGTAVPAQIILAMKQLIADWYENREAVSISRTASAIVELPNAYKALLATYRLKYPGPFSI